MLGEDAEIIDVTPLSARPAPALHLPRAVRFHALTPRRVRWDRLFKGWLYVVGFVVSAAFAYMAVVVLL